MKSIFFLAWILAWPEARAAAPSPFRVQMSGDNLRLDGPYGKKDLFGPSGLRDLRNFRVTVPLAEWRKQAEAQTAAPPALNFEADTNQLLTKANEAYVAAEFPRALSLVETALTRAPQNLRALMMKGSLLHLSGQKSAARETWRKAQELDPANPEIIRVLEKFQ